MFSRIWWWRLQLTLSRNSLECPQIVFLQLRQMSWNSAIFRDEGDIRASVTRLSAAGDCEGFFTADPPSTTTPMWGVHAFPAFLECCLSAPSSAKELLTAINYRAGWTKGHSSCWNIRQMRPCIHTETPPAPARSSSSHPSNACLLHQQETQKQTTVTLLKFTLNRIKS